MKNIAGIFETSVEASRAVDALIDEGFQKKDISLAVSDHPSDRVFTGVTTLKQGGEDAAQGGLAGAVAGGALGALIAGLTATGSLLLPGTGLLMTGPLVAALSGAGAGAILGGLGGALVEAGFSEDELAHYEKELKAGKAVIVVHAHSAKQERAARQILGGAGAYTQAA